MRYRRDTGTGKIHRRDIPKKSRGRASASTIYRRYWIVVYIYYYIHIYSILHRQFLHVFIVRPHNPRPPHLLLDLCPVSVCVCTRTRHTCRESRGNISAIHRVYTHLSPLFLGRVHVAVSTDLLLAAHSKSIKGPHLTVTRHGHKKKKEAIYMPMPG